MNRFEVFVILVFCISWSHCTFPRESHEECLNRVYKRNCSGTSDKSRGVTQKEKDEIVNLHNHYRRLTAEGKLTARPGVTLPEAANMMKMKWDDELQKSAERWADYCTFKIDPCRNVTDKRWTVSQCWAKMDGYHNWTEAVSVMFKGISSFEASEIWKYSDYKHFCAHQIIWHNIYAVGCAKTQVGSIYFYVCNYAPDEIQVGKPTYAVGNPCSKCPSGTICENSLCAFTTKRELNEEIAIAIENMEYRKDDIKKCVIKKFSDMSVLMENFGRIIGEGGKLDLTVGEDLSKKLKSIKDMINSIAQFLNNLEKEKDVGQNYIRSWLTELYIGQTNPLLNVTSPPKIANINNMVNKLIKLLQNIKLVKHSDEGLVKKLENQIADISDLVETYLSLGDAEGNPNGHPVGNSEVKLYNFDRVINDIEEKLDKKGQISDNTIEDLSSIISILRGSLVDGSTRVIDNDKDTIKRNNAIKGMIRALGKEIRNLISYQEGSMTGNLNGIKNITNDLSKTLDEVIEESMSFPEKLEKQINRFETKVENIGEIFDNAEEPYINYKALELKLVELTNLLRNLMKTVKDRNPKKGELPDYLQKKLIKMQVTPMKLLVKMKKEVKDIPENLERKITDTNQMLGNLGGALENVMSDSLRELLREMFDISKMFDTYTTVIGSRSCRI